MDRPVKINKSGKYNLNFIDWTNEWQRIAEAGGYNPDIPPTKSPIYGMSLQVFKSLMAAQLRQMEYAEQVVRKQVYGLGDLKSQVKQMKIGQTEKQCTICIRDFVREQLIRMLPCKHIFHEQCIMPWLDRNSNCPNCKFDLKAHFKK